MRNNNITEKEYVQNLQLEILNNKIFEHIYNIKFYNKSFSRDFYNWQNKELDLNYIFTPYLQNTKKSQDENSKRNYFNNNKKNWFTYN